MIAAPNRTSFRLAVLAILLVGIWIGFRQRELLRTAREAQATPTLQTAPAATPPSHSVLLTTPPFQPPPPSPRPSMELLKLRAEVTRLRQELDASTPRAQAIAHAADEWAHVWAGVRPSQQPGFTYFTQVAPAGFGTPEAAFASFQHAMRHQDTEPIVPSRMKDLWDVPDDFDDPNARYSIDIGAGIGGELGYRVVHQERVDSNQVRLVTEMENPDGSSFRQERILVQRDGRWRLKPEALHRQPNLPPNTPTPSGPPRTSSSEVFLP